MAKVIKCGKVFLTKEQKHQDVCSKIQSLPSHTFTITHQILYIKSVKAKNNAEQKNL